MGLIYHIQLGTLAYRLQVAWDDCPKWSDDYRKD